MSKKSLDELIDRVYSVGLAPYAQSIRQHWFGDIKRVLDVGCGAGQWSFAAASLNPRASVIGLDINRYLLGFSIGFAEKYHYANCRFINDSYENLSTLFEENSFDLIMCNGVIQNIDEQKAFKLFSYLLKKNGILLMFWNHGPGYHLFRMIWNLRNLKLRDSVYPFRVLAIFPLRRLLFGRASSEHFVTFRGLAASAQRAGLTLRIIETQPMLGYAEEFWGFPVVFSCKGVKAKL